MGIGNYSDKNFLSYLNIQNNNGTVKLVGAINGAGTGTGSFSKSSYSFLNILANYFNLSSSYINTNEIISSTGKAVKYYFTQNVSNTNAVDLVIAYQDESQINYDDVFTLNLTPDKNYILDKVLKPVENIQELGESLVSRYMISPYYVQYPDINGNFNPNEEPSNWFKKMYGVTTTWQIIFNTESVYFRTEGSLASSGRSNGLQVDAGRNATGSFNALAITYFPGNSGIITAAQGKAANYYEGGFGVEYTHYINLSCAYTTANEFRTINRLIRVYKLLTANGKTVSQIMAGV